MNRVADAWLKGENTAPSCSRSKEMYRFLVVLGVCLFLSGCSDDPQPIVDSGTPDASVDTLAPDTGTKDTATTPDSEPDSHAASERGRSPEARSTPAAGMGRFRFPGNSRGLLGSRTNTTPNHSDWSSVGRDRIGEPDAAPLARQSPA